MRGSFAAARGLRLRLRRRMTRFDPGWRLSRPRSPTAGGTALRSPAVRVRVAPRTRCLSGRRSSAPCKGGSPVRPWGEARGGRWGNRQTRSALTREFPGSRPGRPAHACLVVTAARALGKGVDGVQFSGQAPCDRSVSGSARDLAKVLARVRISSVTLKPL